MKINILNYETYIYEFTYEIYTMIHIFCYPKCTFLSAKCPRDFPYNNLHIKAYIILTIPSIP